MKARHLLIGLLVIVLLLFAGALAYFLRMQAETNVMTPLPTGEVIRDVIAVRDDYVNLYFIPCRQEWIAFDAGISKKSVRKSLEDLYIDPQRVSAVFLTHSDNDHTGALTLFQNATVYLSLAEEQMINGQTKRAFVFSNQGIAPYKTLADGENVQISGCSVTGILAPGHTPGSMVYRVNDGLLFSGDSFSLKNGKALPFNEFFNMDTPRQVQSLEKLRNLSGLTTIFSAHYGYAPASALR